MRRGDEESNHQEPPTCATPLTTHHLSLTTHHSPLTTHHSLLTTCAAPQPPATSSSCPSATSSTCHIREPSAGRLTKRGQRRTRVTPSHPYQAERATHASHIRQVTHHSATQNSPSTACCLAPDLTVLYYFLKCSVLFV